ncbi:ParB N-terminal domain-containing protein [Sulfitobacter sp. M57]|uniref:ParB/RepB/Spo0J family partition protein n=1 Tax=unclassified Sulfitobacter TaxID=196795 RepID=UPI0023E219C5|nr:MULTISPECIES: ParB N-terminal domain-containing protein [unclassified Sulfitobacter]MDF3416485.1 ParB N-terminal domain-containing protein [Sulfitobacter sp. KE5]MDF3423960.1 ParB N-terminal domain-containing protein [Sulfitobacter sp. KE43]MDF3435061.1 ParB N-terminal domain-containing protein [Sulfitobacter sp. KE42]MDF3460735.1 ParB N-terminal domain-containing protein [Sulfitobacter sp. S74]MDF3464574.1 ParB N-terminal domain-containing protein [Sulfitobacter sp. Ks18]
MAKRRKLEAPSADALGRIEEEFRRETPAHPISAPIAQVAADTAGALQAGTPEMRRDEAEAAAYRDAEGQGRLIKEIPLAEIEAMSMQRDRTVMDAESLDELQHSIAAHGLRLPVEVYVLTNAAGGKRYGLLSGYRRLIAQQNLLARTGEDRFSRIKAVVRDPDQIGGAFVAMVEENEIRQDLSHYERGRIAVIATQQGAFPTTEAAVAEMFAAASKAKRSKIRSFAMIFEALGDVLQFPESLREKDGLRLAQGVRTGAETRLREVLGAAQVTDPKSELTLIESVLAEQSSTGDAPSRGGRPRAATPKTGWSGDTLRTSTGVTMQAENSDDGFVIRFRGKGLSQEMAKALMLDLQAKLEKG